MFEKYNFAGVFIQVQAVLTLYAQGAYRDWIKVESSNVSFRGEACFVIAWFISRHACDEHFYNEILEWKFIKCD